MTDVPPPSPRIDPLPLSAGPLVAPRRAGACAPRRPRRSLVRDVLVLNLTPMLDVIFNVLLFLIVVTRFSAPEGILPAKLPAKAAAGAPDVAYEVPRSPIRLFLSPDSAGGCVVRLDDRAAPPVPRSELASRLAAFLDRPGYDSRTPVYLWAADDVRWDDVVNAYNAALAASLPRIFFAGS